MLMKIVVAEDDLSTRVLLKKILERNNYTVFEADSGQAVLKIPELPHVDIFLIDVLMPKMSGIDLIAHLKKNPITAKKPVILCTSNTNQDTVQKAISLGIAGYVIKPINANSLIKTIQKCKKQISPVLENQSQISKRLGLSYAEYGDLLKLWVADAKGQLQNMGRNIEKGELIQFAKFVSDLGVSAENLGAARLHTVASEAKIAATPDSDKELLLKYLFYLKTEIDQLHHTVANNF